MERAEIEALMVADLPDSMTTKITITDLLSREGMAVVVKVQVPEITTIMTKIPMVPKGQDLSSNSQEETTVMVDSSLLVVLSQAEDIEIGSKTTSSLMVVLSQAEDIEIGSKTTSSQLVVLSQVEDIEIGSKTTIMRDLLPADSNLPLEILLDSSTVSMMKPPHTPEVAEAAVGANAVEWEAEVVLPEVGSAAEEAVNNSSMIISDERYKEQKLHVV